MFKLPQLTYSRSGLEPFLSAETIEYHYEKHHKNYIVKTNQLIRGTKFENASLEEIVLLADGELFNNASQAWNHSFYWRCLAPLDKGDHNKLPELLNNEIEKAFHSLAEFKSAFSAKAVKLFGSGWAWLVADRDKNLSVIELKDGDSPMLKGFTPLLACDVWEHAYYIDYRNNRQRYVDGFLQCVNWDFVNKNWEVGSIPNMTKYMTTGGYKAPDTFGQNHPTL